MARTNTNPVTVRKTAPETRLMMAGKKRDAENETHIGSIMGTSIRISLLASSIDCKCATCKAARKLAPHVAAILEQDENAKD